VGETDGASRHVPHRTCVGCRRARPADALVRVARRPDGSLTLERSAPGRGAWLCRGSVACLDEAVRRHGFERAFRAAVPGDEVRRVRAQLVQAWGRLAPDVRGWGAGLIPVPETDKGRREPLAEEDSRL